MYAHTQTSVHSRTKLLKGREATKWEQEKITNQL